MPTSPTKPTTSSDTGKASVTKVGHTAQKNYGTNPDMRGKGQAPVRDLDIKTSR